MQVTTEKWGLNEQMLRKLPILTEEMLSWGMRNGLFIRLWHQVLKCKFLVIAVVLVWVLLRVEPEMGHWDRQ